jgi:hypothetical protein
MIVVPAKAGTHDHLGAYFARSVIIGSRVRGNDSKPPP